MTVSTAPPTRPRRRWWALAGLGGGLLALVCAVLLVGLAILGTRLREGLALQGAFQPDETVSVGEPAPDFTLSDLDGRPVRLSDQRGKPVLVNFFATWCGPCRAEMADIAQTRDLHASEGLVVLEIDQREGAGTVRGFVRQEKLSLTVLLDGDGRIGSRYGVRALPTTFFVDRDGTVQHRVLGAMGPGTLKKKLVDILPTP
jgi:peroxiredoxin